MSVTTTVQKLRQKYGGFQAPLARIRVEGEEIVAANKGRLIQLVVELTSGFEASGCRFVLDGEYDYSKTDFSSSGPVPKLQLGAKVTVEAGYITTEPVFEGLITRVDYALSSDQPPTVEVECADAKCLLMKTRRLAIRSEKKMSAAIEALLSEQPLTQYIGGKEVDAFGRDETVIPTALESDYHFLTEQAAYYGREFFILQGKVYFRERPASSPTVMTISTDLPIYSARLSLRGDVLLDTVTVKGIDEATGKEVSGTSKVSGKFSSGSTAARMTGSTERVEFDPLVASAGEASDRAKAIAKGISGRFGQLELRCTGIPELAPGRYIAVEKLFSQANRTYYITKVRHTLDAGGFYTTMEAGVDSL